MGDFLHMKEKKDQGLSLLKLVEDKAMLKLMIELRG